MTERVPHRWTPIQDYEVPPSRLARPELRYLAEISQEQRQPLEDTEGWATFNERLRREWAIETGLLERIYTFDRGVTQMLIEQGIDAALMTDIGTQDPNRVAAIIRDHQDAVEGLFAFVRGKRQLTLGYTKDLHAQLTRHQRATTALDPHGNLVELPLLRGAFKSHPNNPLRPDGSVHEYCPPEHVAPEMERLVQLHREHENASIEVEAAWLHHRFTQRTSRSARSSRARTARATPRARRRLPSRRSRTRPGTGAPPAPRRADAPGSARTRRGRAP